MVHILNLLIVAGEFESHIHLEVILRMTLVSKYALPIFEMKCIGVPVIF